MADFGPRKRRQFVEFRLGPQWRRPRWSLAGGWATASRTVWACSHRRAPARVRI